MSLKVIKSGPLASIQDKGRYSGLTMGIPISGVMDSRLSTYANRILGNPEQVPVIEIMGQGAKFQFFKSTYIVFAALDADILLNGKPIRTFEIYKVANGDVLQLKRINLGMWTYLAVKNGFQIEQKMGSSSYYAQVFDQAKLNNNSVVNFNTSAEVIKENLAQRLDFKTTEVVDIKCFKLPEFKLLSKSVQYQLLNAEFSISNQINRMAYQISERLDNQLEEILTSPVLPGTVQFTSGGKLIILMRDAQATGGYPRIFQLTENSICQLAQARPRQKLKFSLAEPT
ncbi:biotin-dependent carboxyltransferase family protein [Psychroflexus sp. ALD_RP9]|uniref:5-oxoprolinase subunit C family protein n=1 Tax=Psychroflexus sp. ALD_RP9 TaxID=2777186 RepID=UPI001A909883|nr:biotin-dependent carboxyltransferase family protein [Psychroflexus sp. ALD_RP9]QSS97275.1 biotin-dependent carboxyltransferase family protein [Psychroflexus sp. ALD_RP9]